MSHRVLACCSLTAACLLVAALHGAPQAAPAAGDLIARSLAAHGGDRLSSWTTLAMTGTTEMTDGITYLTAYRIWAKRPDRIKVEQDMTVSRGGRLTYEYFRNGGQAWGRRNLIPTKADPARLERWWNQCLGIAHYAKAAAAFALKGEGTSDWQAKKDTAYEVTERRPAWIVTATIGADTVDLYIDKTTFHLLEEVTPQGRRLFSAFTSVGGAVHPTRILEVTRGRGGEVITPVTWETIRYGVEIEDWVFEEDMPKK